MCWFKAKGNSYIVSQRCFQRADGLPWYSINCTNPFGCTGNVVLSSSVTKRQMSWLCFPWLLTPSTQLKQNAYLPKTFSFLPGKPQQAAALDSHVWRNGLATNFLSMQIRRDDFVTSQLPLKTQTVRFPSRSINNLQNTHFWYIMPTTHTYQITEPNE